MAHGSHVHDASIQSKMEEPKKKFKSGLEVLGLDKTDFVCGPHARYTCIPGQYLVFPPDVVVEQLKSVKFVQLFPIILSPNPRKAATLDAALCGKNSKTAGSSSSATVNATADSSIDNLAFSAMDHRVSVDVDQNAKKFFLGFCLSGLEDLEANDPIVPVFRQLVVSIVEVYHGFEKDWQTNQDGQKELCDKHLLSKVCLFVLGCFCPAVVYEECRIAGQRLPHGDVDIVAGQLNADDDITYTFGCTCVVDGDPVGLYDPFGVSAKTETTLKREAVNPQVVVEHLAFSEVVKSPEGTPCLFFAASRCAFRPFIRVKELDITLTTTNVIEWWDKLNNKPDLGGLAILIALIWGVSNSTKIKLSSESILKAVDKKARIWPKTKWNEVYNNSTEKYANKFIPQKRETFKDTKHRKPKGLMGTVEEYFALKKEINE